MPEIKLKVRCTGCDGTGAYRSPADPEGVPCWQCHGKGWHYSTMRAPELKWEQRYKAEQRKRSSRSEPGA